MQNMQKSSTPTGLGLGLVSCPQKRGMAVGTARAFGPEVGGPAQNTTLLIGAQPISGGVCWDHPTSPNAMPRCGSGEMQRSKAARMQGLTPCSQCTDASISSCKSTTNSCTHDDTAKR